MIDALDAGLVETRIFEIFEPIMNNQWTPDDIVSHWSISRNCINPSCSDSFWELKIYPTITGNTGGDDPETYLEQSIDEIQTIIRNDLNAFGITSFEWTLFYPSGTVTQTE